MLIQKLDEFNKRDKSGVYIDLAADKVFIGGIEVEGTRDEKIGALKNIPDFYKEAINALK